MKYRLVKFISHSGYRSKKKSRGINTKPGGLLLLTNNPIINKIKYRSTKVELLKKQGDNSWIMVSLTEGKKQEIWAVMEHFGFQVNKLIRLKYGKFA